MKLLSILIEENIEWPSGMVWCVQDDDGNIKFSSDLSFKPIYCNTGIWSRGRIGGNDTTVHGYPVSDDWHKTVISYEEYKRAKELHDGHDSSWFEKGEFPPVGCECRVKHRSWSVAYQFKIVAITKEYVIVEGSGLDEQHYYLKDITFQPLKTEQEIKREKAIEDMKSICKHKGSWDLAFKAFAEDLIDAGYHKD